MLEFTTKKYTDDTAWHPLPGFSRYFISARGEVLNGHRQVIIRPSLTQNGHQKISIFDDEGIRVTKSVAKLVALTFLPPPTQDFDSLIHLNGDLSDPYYLNLAWRPRWFAIRYHSQFLYSEKHHPKYDVPVELVNYPYTTEKYSRGAFNSQLRFESIVDCGIYFGVLWDDIWRSTYLNKLVFPIHAQFKVIKE